MRQYQVRTQNYSWEYDIEEDPTSRCKRWGVISRQGMIDRSLAIAAGEYKPVDEPKCWKAVKESE